MPITPFHFGPGAALHAIAPRHVSFLAFCGANVLIDVESLYFMLTRQYPLHRVFHTYVGATMLAIAAVGLFLAARYVASRARFPNVFGWKSLTISQVSTGAVLGLYSHIALDSLMHDDIRPFVPFSRGNPMLGVVDLGSLHWFCLLAGFGGVAILALRRFLQPGKV